jgi:hypothetical protein
MDSYNEIFLHRLPSFRIVIESGLRKNRRLDVDHAVKKEASSDLLTNTGVGEAASFGFFDNYRNYVIKRNADKPSSIEPRDGLDVDPCTAFRQCFHVSRHLLL